VIVYLDATAFVKLDVEEPGSVRIAAEVERASGAATARVT
jgi:hypothetical protein